MAEQKKPDEIKAPRPRPQRRDATEQFDPYWTNKSGTVKSVSEYVEKVAREPRGFFRGARVYR